MPKANTEWKVLRHGPIDKLEPNLWCVTGSLANMAMRRVMTLVRLDDGRIVIHSAIALDEPAMAEIEEWGRPAILLVPNRFHRLDAPAFLARYPELEVLCPRGGRRQVEEVIRVDGDYDSFQENPTLGLVYLEGVAKTEGVMVVHSASGATLVFNDALFNMPHGSGLGGLVLRHVLGSTGGPRVTRLFRLLAIKDKTALRTHFEALAETPQLFRIIVSHHEMITDRPAETLREVAATL